MEPGKAVRFVASHAQEAQLLVPMRRRERQL